MNPTDILSAINSSGLELDNVRLSLARRSMREYLNMVNIRCHPSPRPLGQVAEPWQWMNLYEPMIPAFEYLASSPEERLVRPFSGPHSFWMTLHRGADKSSTAARFINYILACGRSDPKCSIRVAASDKDQAKIIRDLMVVERDLNPWFGRLIKIDNYAAYGPGGHVEIMAADAGGAYGGGSDLILMDEVTHWKSNSMYTALMSESIKVYNCVVVILSNAGYYDTWQSEAIDLAKSNPDWCVYDQPGYKAGWTRPEKVAAERENIIRTTGSHLEAARLFDNIWISSAMGSAFAQDTIDDAIDIQADIIAFAGASPER